MNCFLAHVYADYCTASCKFSRLYTMRLCWRIYLDTLLENTFGCFAVWLLESVALLLYVVQLGWDFRGRRVGLFLALIFNSFDIYSYWRVHLKLLCLRWPMVLCIVLGVDTPVQAVSLAVLNSQLISSIFIHLQWYENFIYSSCRPTLVPSFGANAGTSGGRCHG